MTAKPSSAVPPAALAIDAGGTFFKSALVDRAGVPVPGSFRKHPVDAAGCRSAILAVYRRILAQALACAARNGVEIAGLGIATPGPFDYARGMSRMTHKFQALRDLNLKDAFAAMALFPATMPVVFLHDAHAFLAGEFWTGAARGIDSVAAVVLGTGLGFGLMQQGRILDNGAGGPRVSIFSRPHAGGILEDAVSRRGIVSAYRRVAPCAGDDIDVRDIATRARSGDEQARRVFAAVGDVLAESIADILAAHAVQRVIFGGQISKAFRWFGPAFQERLASTGNAVDARPGRNIPRSALIGAARSVFCGDTPPDNEIHPSALGG